MRVSFAYLCAFLCALLITNVVTADEPKAPKEKKQGEETTLEPHKCGDIERLHVFGSFYLAGQPNADDLKLLKDSGIKSVINLRQQDELDWDEAARVKELGMRYHHLPFRSPDSLTDAVFNSARKLLNDKKNQPVVLHCGSANRVGAIWLVYRVLDNGTEYDAALAEAKTVGLRLPAYEEIAKDYIERMKK